MPYTPPSHRSPASSQPSSPNASRRPSIAGGGSRSPALPRSASYLTRHRRTPSAPSVQNGQPTPEPTSDNLAAMLSNSVRKSPPPVTDGLGMPHGAILSPPESTASSDDDETPDVRGRALENLKELHAAISQIPQHRESSPTKSASPVVNATLPQQTSNRSQVLHASFSSNSLDKYGCRKTHTRSNTEPTVMITAENSTTASEADSDEELLLKKPQMVRKKSGELVRPALRPSSRRRPSSMPGTPTFSKAVHFDSHLEHVRHFLQVDRPLAVSAGSSPADNYSSDSEFPFNSGEERSGTRSPPYEWEIIVTNFPLETPARKSMPVRLERVWLSPDQKSLIGSVAVANLAFQKQVTCRFTFDYWKTTSEVAAEYSSEIRPKEDDVGHDRFNFTIKLSELANLESKTLYFCLRYNVNGQEYWDSNGGTNFQVDFRKKMLPQLGKRGFQGASSRPAGELPRSSRRHTPVSGGRPSARPMGNEFGENGNLDPLDQTLQDYLGDDAGPLRLKGVKSTSSLPSDNLTGRLSAPSGQAFANRYDFGASLNTAIQAAKQTSPRSVKKSSDGLYMKGNTRGSSMGSPPKSQPTPPVVNANVASNNKTVENKHQVTREEPSALAKDPAPFAAANTPSAPIMATASYEELVNKYCFFGSKQSSPQLGDGTLRSGRFDGIADEMFSHSAQSSSDSSVVSSPLQMATILRTRVPAMQNAGLRQDSNPYFASPNGAGYPLPASISAMPQVSDLPLGSMQSNPHPSTQHSTVPNRSTSPASMAGGYPQAMTGTSQSMQYHQQFHDRFPFGGADAHAATAIRG